MCQCCCWNTRRKPARPTLKTCRQIKGLDAYYDTNQGFWDRLQFISADDALNNITDQGAHFGLRPLQYALYNAVPHIIWPNKPTMNAGYAYAHEISGEAHRPGRPGNRNRVQCDRGGIPHGSMASAFCSSPPGLASVLRRVRLPARRPENDAMGPPRPGDDQPHCTRGRSDRRDLSAQFRNRDSPLLRTLRQMGCTVRGGCRPRSRAETAPEPSCAAP